MLISRTIPQYSTDPEDWHRFIDKVAKGSSKAQDVLSHAEMAYMVAVTGNPTAPETIPMDAYTALFRSIFPPTPPKSQIDKLVKLANENHWIPRPFNTSNDPPNDSSHYNKLWSQSKIVRSTELVNDALIYCVNEWSPDNCLACMDEDLCEYNSLFVMSGMLFLALIWPNIPHNAAISNCLQ